MKKAKQEISNNVPLYDASGKPDGTFELDKNVFTGVYNPGLLHQAAVMYQANKRVGKASTKVRGEVSGGGKKPWKQKGTGRARASSIRSPLWRGGGIVFGPHPRDFKYQLPKKIKKAALLSSLNAKLRDGLFGVIKELNLEEPKTAKFKKIIEKTKIGGTILLAVDKIDRNILLASRNFRQARVMLAPDLNSLDVMKVSNFLVTEKAVQGLTKTLEQCALKKK